jgi:cytochrome b561
MQFRNSLERWGSVAKFFHWTIVLLVICQFALALLADDLPVGVEKLKLLARHKSIGITILALATLRLLWRAANRTPALPPTMAAWEKFSAKAAHALLYALLFIVPLAGWTMSSAKNFPVSWFGLVQLPDFVAPNESTYEIAHEIHETLAMTLGIVAVLHLLAALKHHFVNRDAVLKRMWPFARLPVALITVAIAAGAMPGQSLAAQPPGATLRGSGADSTLAFNFTQAGAGTNGSFKAFTTTLVTGEDGAPASLEVTIDVKSIDTGDKERDGLLRDKDLFDVKRFAEAKFAATRFTREASGRYQAIGKLTIRDVTRDVTLPFALTEIPGGDASGWLLAGETVINRLDYGVGQGEWRDTGMVGNAVTVRYSVRLTPVP